MIYFSRRQSYVEIPQRESNIELLRIVSMFMLLCLHANFLAFGNPLNEGISTLETNHIARVLLENLCIIAVNVFVLISGFFGIKFRIKSILSLLFQVLFYNAVCLLIVTFVFEHPITISGFLSVGKWWFFNSYILLYILSPVINAFIKSAERSTYKTIIISFFCTEIYLWKNWDSNFNQGYSCLSFIGLYLISGYIKRYEIYNRIKAPICIIGYFILAVMSTFLCIMLGTSRYDFLAYNSPLVIVESICFFTLFTKFRFTNRLINWLSLSCFSVYLLHCHPLILNLCFVPYCNILRETPNFIFRLIIFIILLFILCIIVDRIRIYIWTKIASLFNFVKK